MKKYDYGWIICPYSKTREDQLNDFYFYDRVGSFCVAYNPYPKYHQDKVYGKAESKFFLTDGVIFNWDGLDHGTKTIRELEPFEGRLAESLIMFKEDPLFFSKFDGTFNGAILDEETNLGTAYTNHVGEREVFYLKEGPGGVWISSNYNILVDLLKNEQFERKLDSLAFRSMVIFGGMHDQRTWIQGINRLLAGQYITFSVNELMVHRYHRFDSSNPDEIYSEEEWIDKLEHSFSRAMELYLKKDDEYGYDSLVDISGGLDSRMVLLAAKRFSKKPYTALSFAAVGSNEQKVAEMVVKEANCSYIFSSLSDAGFVYDIWDILRSNYGLTYYIGITGGKRILGQLNLENTGLELTGLLGEMGSGGYIGEETKSEYRINRSIGYGEDHSLAKKEYPNEEMFYFHTRGPLWGLGSMMIRRQLLESYSPFMNTDFLEISHAIPEKLRIEGHIFLKWMKEKYPSAAKIPYAADMCPPDASKLRKIIQRKIIYRLPGIIRRMKRQLNPSLLQPDPRDMNPLDDWYAKDVDLQKYINTFISDRIDVLNRYDDLRDIYAYYRDQNGSVLEKCAMMTALAAVELYVDLK